MLKQKYSKGYFITLKGSETNPRHQKIGWAYDHLKKISDNFLIVREKNKVNNGFHFHSVVLPYKTPTRSWYRKGIHINVKKVNGPRDVIAIEKKNAPILPVTISAQEQNEMLTLGVITEGEVLDAKIDAILLKAKDSIKKRSSLQRLSDYMFKETTEYVECVKGKFKRDTMK